MVCHALLTTMLVAASIPALPAASRNFTSWVSLAAAKADTWSTTRVSVSALWSRRYTYNVSNEHASLYSPRGAPAVTVLSICWLGRNSYHFGLPSFKPASRRRFSNESELVLSTPSSWRNCHSSASTLFSVAYCEHCPS